MGNRLLFRLIVCALALCLGSCSGSMLIRPSVQPEDGYLIRGVRVFTGLPGMPLKENMDVHIKGEKIVRISPERLEAPGARVIDGKGKTLLPGLTDFHTHITGGMIVPWGSIMPTMRFNFEGCLYSGVTAVVDMNGKTAEEMNEIASDIEAGKIMGPHLFSCGLGFTGKGAHPMPMLEKLKEKYPWFVHPFFPEIAIEVDASAGMDRLEKQLAAKPDFTKIYLDDLPDGTPKMKAETVSEIVRRSHEQGIPVLIHIGRNEDVKIAVESGADGIAHNVYKEPLDPSIASELARRKMFVTPTVYVFHNLNTFVNDRNYTHYSPLEWETMHSSAVKALKNPEPYNEPKGDSWSDYYRNFRETYTGVLHPNVKALKDAGVTIIAGTDAPNLGIAAGGSLHVELQHLVEGGLTPQEALISATSEPARILREVFRKNVDFGTVEEGKGADLLLVNGDPTKNIRDTENIAAVFFRGSLVDRSH